MHCPWHAWKLRNELNFRSAITYSQTGPRSVITPLYRRKSFSNKPMLSYFTWKSFDFPFLNYKFLFFSLSFSFACKFKILIIFYGFSWKLSIRQKRKKENLSRKFISHKVCIFVINSVPSDESIEIFKYCIW